MRLIIICLSVILLAISQVAAQDTAADELFNKASLQYLTGDFQAALKNLTQALKIESSHSGAVKLLKTIQREMRLTAPETPPPAPATVEARLTSQQRRYFVGAIISFGVGLAALAGLIFLAGARIARKVGPRFSRRGDKRSYCFNCGSKVSPNIDLCPNCGAWIGAKLRVSITREQAEWYKKVGWKKNPFTMDIHPELFTGYRAEVKQILEKISEHSGHILVTGPLGVGKTTLLRWLSNYLGDGAIPVYIPRPPQNFDQMLNLIVQKMCGKGQEAIKCDIYHFNELRAKIKKPLVILLDEAHEFTVDIERPLRTLGDLDEVNLVMAGLPETVQKFEKEIKPLYERLVLQIYLEKLEYNDVKELIKARIENVGGSDTNPFTEAALKEIYRLSKGVPRPVIRVCDWAITKAINLHEDKITPELLVGYLPQPETRIK